MHLAGCYHELVQTQLVFNGIVSKLVIEETVRIRCMWMHKTNLYDSMQAQPRSRLYVSGPQLYVDDHLYVDFDQRGDTWLAATCYPLVVSPDASS